MFYRNRGTQGAAVCTAVLKKEEVEGLHLGCGSLGFGFGLGSAVGLGGHGQLHRILIFHLHNFRIRDTGGFSVQ